MHPDVQRGSVAPAQEAQAALDRAAGLLDPAAVPLRAQDGLVKAQEFLDIAADGTPSEAVTAIENARGFVDDTIAHPDVDDPDTIRLLARVDSALERAAARFREAMADGE